MRTLRVLLLLILAGSASAQTYGDCRNAVGVFLWPDADPAGICYTGTPGAFTVHLVVLHPHSWARDAALGSVGGYELRLVLPAGVFLLATTLPPAATNALVPPDFRVTGTLPVVDDQCLLATLSLGAFTQVEGYIYLAPPAEGGTVPGHMAILDGDDGNAAAMAFPISGDYGNPVFGVYPTFGNCGRHPWFDLCGGVVPSRPAGFGAVKALYR